MHVLFFGFTHPHKFSPRATKLKRLTNLKTYKTKSKQNAMKFSVLAILLCPLSVVVGSNPWCRWTGCSAGGCHSDEMEVRSRSCFIYNDEYCCKKEFCRWTGCHSGGCASDEVEVGSELCGNFYNNEACCKTPAPPTPPLNPPPTPPPTVNCNIEIFVVGQWVPVAFSNGNQRIEYTVGTTFTDGRDVTNSWARAVTTSVGANLAFEGIGGIETSTSSEYTEGAEHSVSDSISRDSQTVHETTFDGPGQVWQFAYSVEDDCSSAEIKTYDLVLTDGRDAPPCCLPGFFDDPAVIHGICVEGSPCTCYDALCHPSDAPSPRPSSVPSAIPQPSSVPSSAIPSDLPSPVPSAPLASGLPSMLPSGLPSSAPTVPTLVANKIVSDNLNTSGAAPWSMLLATFLSLSVAVVVVVVVVY